MAKSNMDQDILKVLITQDEIQARTQELGDRLTQAGVPVVLFNLREPSLHEIFVETVGGESDA